MSKFIGLLLGIFLVFGVNRVLFAESVGELLNGLVSMTISLNLDKKVEGPLLKKANTARAKYMANNKKSVPLALKNTQAYKKQVGKFEAKGRLSVEYAAALSSQADRVIQALVEVVSGVVAATGALVEVTNPSSPIYKASVEVPPGAVPAGTVVEMRQEAFPPSLPSNVDAVGPCVDYGPEGLKFAVPVRIGVPYSDVGVEDEGALRLFSYDVGVGGWVEVPIVERDMVANVVYAKVSHFSLYQVVGPAPSEVVDPLAPYFNLAALWASQSSGGTSVVMVADVRDPDGAVPSSIESLELIDSLGNAVATFKKGDYYFDTANKLYYDMGHSEVPYEFYLRTLSGVSLESGEYVLRAMDVDGRVGEWRKELSVRPIPVVDSSTIRFKDQQSDQWITAHMFEGVRLDLPLTVTWQPVFYGGAPVYYRVVIQNWNQTIIYRSQRSASHEVTISADVLSSLLIPKAAYGLYVEAYDSPSGPDASNRSMSNIIYFTTQGLSFQDPMFRWASARIYRYPEIPVFVRGAARVTNGLKGEDLTPQDVTVTVLTPEGQEVPLDGYYAQYQGYDGRQWGEFGTRADAISGLPLGHYVFRAVSSTGKEVYLKDYLNRSHLLPFPTPVDPPDGAVIVDTTTPTFSWEDLGEATTFSISLETQIGVSWTPIFVSPYVRGTSYTLPGGLLQRGKPYRWRVRCHDGTGAATEDTRSYSDYQYFSLQ